MERGKQTFSLLRHGGSSSSGQGGGRHRTRSPPPHRLREATTGNDGDGRGSESRGRTLSRGGHSSPRRQEPPRREDADWERRRSRSPARKTAADADTVAVDGVEASAGDLGSALLSGNLPMATGALPPPPLHPDHMMDFYTRHALVTFGQA